MKKYAVGYIDWFEHELTIEIIEAENWQSALLAHSKIGVDTWEETEGKSLQDLKQEAFDCDCMVDVKEIV